MIVFRTWGAIETIVGNLFRGPRRRETSMNQMTFGHPKPGGEYRSEGENQLKIIWFQAYSWTVVVMTAFLELVIRNDEVSPLLLVFKILGVLNQHCFTTSICEQR